MSRPAQDAGKRPVLGQIETLRLCRTLNSTQEIESRLDRVSPTNFDFISQRQAAGRSIRKQPPVFEFFMPFSPDSAITKNLPPCTRTSHYVKSFLLLPGASLLHRPRRHFGRALLRSHLPILKAARSPVGAREISQTRSVWNPATKTHPSQMDGGNSRAAAQRRRPFHTLRPEGGMALT
jgi:hypothetical protein